MTTATKKEHESLTKEERARLEERSRLEEAISRLSRENAKHREELEQLAAMMRLRSSSPVSSVDVSCLKPTAALAAILDSRDDLAKKLTKLEALLAGIKAVLTRCSVAALNQSPVREIHEYVSRRRAP